MFPDELKKERGGHSQTLLSEFLMRGEGQLTQVEAEVQAVQLGMEALQLTQVNPLK